MLNNTIKLPEVVVFACPNGSGKTTITRMAKVVGDYINADDNTKEPFRIFKKRKAVCYRWCNQYWSNEDIERLTGITSF